MNDLYKEFYDAFWAYEEAIINFDGPACEQAHKRMGLAQHAIDPRRCNPNLCGELHA